MKKHVVITCSNATYGDFLIKNWLASLRKNVNLAHTDIIVIDYGLTPHQMQQLTRSGVFVFPGKLKGHIVVSRFLDTEKILDNSSYDQVLLIDGGDIVFQDDIYPLFDKNKTRFRLVTIDMEVLFHEVFIRDNFPDNLAKKMYEFLKNKPVLNAGFVLGPRKKFIALCRGINRLISNKAHYGPDQVALNYLLHQQGVMLLDKKYNFMVNTVKDGFILRNGLFYLKNGDLISVVHNAGHNGFLRPVINFGYGKGYNTVNYPMYWFKYFYYRLLGQIKKHFIL